MEKFSDLAGEGEAGGVESGEDARKRVPPRGEGNGRVALLRDLATAAKFMGGSLHEVGGCPLYILNINETSPAVHILTKITKDTLTVATFYDNCDYERRPFDMYVGFLFSYCEELSEKPEIVIKSTLNEAMTSCGSVDYKEYISKKILPAATTISPIQD